MSLGFSSSCFCFFIAPWLHDLFLEAVIGTCWFKWEGFCWMLLHCATLVTVFCWICGYLVIFLPYIALHSICKFTFCMYILPMAVGTIVLSNDPTISLTPSTRVSYQSFHCNSWYKVVMNNVYIAILILENLIMNEHNWKREKCLISIHICGTFVGSCIAINYTLIQLELY